MLKYAVQIDLKKLVSIIHSFFEFSRYSEGVSELCYIRIKYCLDLHPSRGFQRALWFESEFHGPCMW